MTAFHSWVKPFNDIYTVQAASRRCIFLATKTLFGPRRHPFQVTPISQLR